MQHLHGFKIFSSLMTDEDFQGCIFFEKRQKKSPPNGELYILSVK
jgi:hypothetical protein